MNIETLHDIKDVIIKQLLAAKLDDRLNSSTQFEIMNGRNFYLKDVVLNSLSKYVVWVFTNKGTADVYTGKLVSDWLISRAHDDYKFYIKTDGLYVGDKYAYYPVEEVNVSEEEDSIVLDFLVNPTNVKYITTH